MNVFTSVCLACLIAGPGRLDAESLPEPTRYEFTQIVMGGSAHLVFYAENAEKAHDAAKAAFARLNALDAVMSDYRPDSELMRLCRAEPQTPVAISADLLDVLTIAQQVSAHTDGAFDPTVGPVVRLWREARKTGVAPTSAQIDAARARTGVQHLTLDQAASTATLHAADMQLDLGGIGKGFAAGEAIHTLADLGIESALVDLGGDLVVSAPPPGKDGWTVTIDNGVDDPYQVRLAHAAIATSGDLEQHVVIDGQRYSHIVDPRTGLALTTNAAATILAPTGALADALASAACVLGPSDAFMQAMNRFDHVAGSVTSSTRTARQGADPVVRLHRRATPGMPESGDFWTP